MAKRAARRAKLHAIDSARIHNLVFDHTPANDRDQSYVRKIRPRSDNQRILMEAIDTKPLTVALGPAGTGKTYLAISAAVEAIAEDEVPIVLAYSIGKAQEAAAILTASEVPTVLHGAAWKLLPVFAAAGVPFPISRAYETGPPVPGEALMTPPSTARSASSNATSRAPAPSRL